MRPSAVDQRARSGSSIDLNHHRRRQYPLRDLHRVGCGRRWRHGITRHARDSRRRRAGRSYVGGAGTPSECGTAVAGKAADHEGGKGSDRDDRGRTRTAATVRPRGQAPVAEEERSAGPSGLHRLTARRRPRSKCGIQTSEPARYGASAVEEVGGGSLNGPKYRESDASPSASVVGRSSSTTH